MELNTTWLFELLKGSHSQAEPLEIIDVTVQRNVVPEGGNYFSAISRIGMKYLAASGRRNTVSLIDKLMNYSEEDRNPINTKIRLMAANEFKMYTRILNEMDALLDEFNDKRPTLWPKFYGSRSNSGIELVLEDLKHANYEVVDRTQLLGLDHSLLVLRSLGRFHALTKVLIERGAITEDDRGFCVMGAANETQPKVFQGALHLLSRAIITQTGYWCAGWEKVAKRIQAQIPTIRDTMEAAMTQYNKDFEVLNHGDMWSANIMFEHMEYVGSPIGVKFIDYQVPHLNSFMLDVTYFLYSSSKPSVRRAHMDKLLAEYHRSLSDNLNFFGYGGYVPTLDDVASENKRLLPVAFAVVSSIMPLISASSAKPVDFDKLMDHPPEVALDAAAFSEENFVNEICDDLTNFIALGVI